MSLKACMHFVCNCMKNGIFVFNELCLCFLAGLLGSMLGGGGGGTSRILKFDAKDK